MQLRSPKTEVSPQNAGVKAWLRWCSLLVLVTAAWLVGAARCRGEIRDASFPLNTERCIQALGVAYERRTDPVTRLDVLMVRRKDAFRVTNRCA